MVYLVSRTSDLYTELLDSAVQLEKQSGTHSLSCNAKESNHIIFTLIIIRIFSLNTQLNSNNATSNTTLYTSYSVTLVCVLDDFDQ